MERDERFVNRPVGDLLLYGWVRGLQRGLPSVSDERAIALFISEFGQLFGNPSPEALRQRLQRMTSEYNDAMKTPKAAQGAEELPRQ